MARSNLIRRARQVRDQPLAEGDFLHFAWADLTSMIKPLTEIIQAIGLRSIRLGSVHSGSIKLMFRMSMICLDLLPTVLWLRPNCFARSSARMCGVWLLSNRKLTWPMAWAIAAAQVLALTAFQRRRSFAGELGRQCADTWAYSSFRCVAAKRIGQLDDLIVDRPYLLGNLLGGCGWHGVHFFRLRLRVFAACLRLDFAFALISFSGLRN